MTEVQGSGTIMITDGKKDVNLTEMYHRIPIRDMVWIDIVAQREQAEAESTVTHLR